MRRSFLFSAPVIAIAAFSTCSVVELPVADACTRAVYFGKEKQTVTGRSMDWVEDMQTNLWAFPRGMKRDGGLGKGRLNGPVSMGV